MSKFIKILWTLTSLVPLLFVLILVFAADYLWKNTMNYSLTYLKILIPMCVILVFLFFFIVSKMKKISGITFNVEEMESKDESVAANMMTYLLPLVTIAFNEINWFAFLGMVVVMFCLLFSTRVILLNPLMYILKYKYYTIKSTSGAKYTLISKKSKFSKNEKKYMIEIFNNIYLEMEEEK